MTSFFAIMGKIPKNRKFSSSMNSLTDKFIQTLCYFVKFQKSNWEHQIGREFVETKELGLVIIFVISPQK